MLPLFTLQKHCVIGKSNVDGKAFEKVYQDIRTKFENNKEFVKPNSWNLKNWKIIKKYEDNERKKKKKKNEDFQTPAKKNPGFEMIEQQFMFVTPSSCCRASLNNSFPLFSPLRNMPTPCESEMKKKVEFRFKSAQKETQNRKKKKKT